MGCRNNLFGRRTGRKHCEIYRGSSLGSFTRVKVKNGKIIGINFKGLNKTGIFHVNKSCCLLEFGDIFLILKESFKIVSDHLKQARSFRHMVKPAANFFFLKFLNPQYTASVKNTDQNIHVFFFFIISSFNLFPHQSHTYLLRKQ